MNLFIQFEKPSGGFLDPSSLTNGVGNGLVYGAIGSALAAIAYFGFKSAGYSAAAIYTAMALPAVVGVAGVLVGLACLVTYAWLLYGLASAFGRR